VQEFHLDPASLVHPVIDGEVTSYFEWLGAGVYRADPRSGAMHGRQFLVREIHYGTDGASVFLRLDFDTRPEQLDGGLELRLHFLHQSSTDAVSVSVHVNGGATHATLQEISVALRDVLEIGVPLRSIGASSGMPLRFQLSLWQGGLPLGTLPHEGWLKLSTAERVAWEG
jgi:hypothetical protein